MAIPGTFPANDRTKYYDRYRAEGRQVNFNVRGLNEAGDPRNPFNQSSLGSISVPPGRRYIPTACTVSSSVPARALLFITEEERNFWGIGDADPNDASSASTGVTLYVDLPNGGSQAVDLAMELPEGCNIAFRLQPYSGTVKPAGSMNLTALDVTNDTNYDAPKVHLVITDSIGWSNIGDWFEGMDDPDYSLYNAISGQPNYRPPFYGHAFWAFRVTEFLRQQGKYTRLVNKGFGGSEMIQKQFAQILRGYYMNIPFDLLSVTIGANDSTTDWTTTRADYFKARLEKIVELRNSLRPGVPINFITPWLLDDINAANKRNTVNTTAPYDDGRTRLKICRDLIFEQMDGRELENIFVIDGFEADFAPYNSLTQQGLKDATFDPATGVVTNSLPLGTAVTDLYFKYNSVNSALSEWYAGQRVHRSGQGHANCANLITAKWQTQPWFANF